MSKHILYSLALLSSIMAETNETELYMDKYLPKERLEPYTQKLGQISDVKKPDINISDFKKEHNITINMNPSQDLQEVAKEMNDYKNSSAFQERFNTAKDYILRDKDIGNYEYLKEQNLSVSPYRSKDGKYYIFISSSMPESVIKNYFEQLDGDDRVVFVLRGFIGGIKYAMPTFDWIADMLTKSEKERYKVNIDIDPELAQECNIERVPAVTTRECATVIYGAVSPQWAFERLTTK